jgi:hypothetical protein
MEDRQRIKTDLKLAKQKIQEDAKYKSNYERKRQLMSKRLSTAENVAQKALASNFGNKSLYKIKTPTKSHMNINVQVTSHASDSKVSKTMNTSNEIVLNSSINSNSLGRSPYRSGAMHSFDAGISPHKSRHHHVEDSISHWDLKHLTSLAPDLTQYQSLEL